jgi:hypothetical protein
MTSGGKGARKNKGSQFMNQDNKPAKAGLLNWWVIIVSLWEIGFGLFPVFTIDSNRWNGDYMVGGFVLFTVAVVGLVNFIGGLFLFKRKEWAWTISLTTLLIIIGITVSDYVGWLRGEGLNFFSQLFGDDLNALNVFWITVITLVPVVTAALLILNRNKLRP